MIMGLTGLLFTYSIEGPVFGLISAIPLVHSPPHFCPSNAIRPQKVINVIYQGEIDPIKSTHETCLNDEDSPELMRLDS